MRSAFGNCGIASGLYGKLQLLCCRICVLVDFRKLRDHFRLFPVFAANLTKLLFRNSLQVVANMLPVIAGNFGFFAAEVTSAHF